MYAWVLQVSHWVADYEYLGVKNEPLPVVPAQGSTRYQTAGKPRYSEQACPASPAPALGSQNKTCVTRGEYL